MQSLSCVLSVFFTSVICGNAISLTNTTSKLENWTLFGTNSGRQKRSDCKPDVTIASEAQIQVLKTEKDDLVLYTLQKDLKYIEVTLTFTFGQETKRFSTERCASHPSCWQAVKVRALRNPRGAKASKWAVELSLGSCSHYQTYSFLYWVNDLHGMSISAQGSSAWFVTPRGLVCPRQVNPSHCPPLGYLDPNGSAQSPKGGASTEIGIIAACLLLALNILVIIALYRRLRTRSESTLELTQIGEEETTSNIANRRVPACSGDGNLYLMPCPRTPARPTVNLPRRCPEPPQISAGDEEGPDYLYLEIPSARPQCQTSTRRNGDFLENGSRSMYDDVSKVCGQGQYDDVNKDCIRVQPRALYCNTVTGRLLEKPPPRFQKNESNHYVNLAGE